jgi:hypothetical protein
MATTREQRGVVNLDEADTDGEQARGAVMNWHGKDGLASFMGQIYGSTVAEFAEIPDGGPYPEEVRRYWDSSYSCEMVEVVATVELKFRVPAHLWDDDTWSDL